MNNQKNAGKNKPLPTVLLIRMVVVAAMCLLSGFVSTPASAWTTIEAQRVLSDEMIRSTICSNIQFDDTDPENRKVIYTNTKEHGKRGIWLVRVISTNVTYGPENPGVTQAYWQVVWNDYIIGKDGFQSSFWSESDARNFEQALIFLAREAQREWDALDSEKQERFQEQAKAWRESPTKPDMPEEARRHKVLAENAFKEKDFNKASAEYSAALDLFPCWPEGQFNLALVSGETKGYRNAIHHMKCYLELVPDAPDAQAARDKIFIWEDKIKPNF